MSEHYIDQVGRVVELRRPTTQMGCEGCLYARKNKVYQCTSKQFGPLDGECTLDEIFVEVKGE